MSESNDIATRRAKLTPAQLALLQRRLRRDGTDDAAPGEAASQAAARVSPEGIARTADDGGCAPVSFMQQGQWFLWQLDAGNTAYHVGGGLGFSGPLDVGALQEAVRRLVLRHDSLRTVFGAGSDGLPVQRIDPAARIDIPFADLSLLDAGARASRHREAVVQVCRAPFDLTAGPLLRGALLKMADDEHQLLLMLHHIVSDAWTVELILDELARLYAQQVDAAAAAAAVSGPEPEIRYIDFARWQHRWLEGEEGARQLAYWRQRLGASQPVLDLATDRPRTANAGYSAAQHALDVPAPLARELKRQARAQGGTLFMVLLAAFHGVLFRYTGQEEIRVGVPVAGRNRPETAGVVGAFINTVVMGARPHTRMPLAELLAQVRDTAFEAQAHQELPYERLVQALRAEGGNAAAPLFQVMFNHLGEGDRPLRGWPRLRVRRIDLEERAAPFELTLETIERADGSIRCAFRYAAELFEPATIARLAGHYHRVLEALAADPQQALGAIALLGDDEHAQLAAWGINAHGHGEAVPVHHVIARRAAAHPHDEALAFGDQVLTYAELDRRANRLAHRLIAHGVRPESLVGVVLERSVELVIALLAVMKAGGAYVPLDPEHPADRIAYMVQDSGLALVLTQGHLAERLPADAGVPLLAIDAPEALGAGDFADSDPAVALDAENLAYVIYTSGSTGKPKGAANRHRALHNRLAWMQQAYGLAPGDTVLQKTPFSFDVSVWEFFWPLMYGARLAVAAPGDHRDPARLVALIRRHRVCTLHFVPSMLQAFLAQPDVEACTTLRRIVCSGEALPAEAQNEVLRRLPQAKLYNLYGPTEAAIDVTHWTCRDDGRSQVSIGRPVSGIQTHVLDASLNLVPAGVAGELYLGGIGLARGYVGRPGLTAVRFVADPFDAERGGRLYRTGDLVRWNSQGQLDYLGRLDHQVKIRGFRIELGEIEAQLLAHPGVREAVVVAQQAPGGARLVAYVSPHAGQDVDAAALREWLGRTLTEYMVPSLLMTLPALPLNANGKIDRKALPLVQATDAGTGAHEPPSGALEETLARVWGELLGVSEVGRHAHFFELGGHSLMAAQLVSRLRAGAALQLPLKEVFDHPVLRDMAVRLQPAEPMAGTPPLMPVARAVQIGLSPTQHRLWLVDRLADAAGRTAYNMATALRFDGPLDPAVLRRALETLVSRHEVLRMAYPENDEGEPVATIAPMAAFDLPWIDSSVAPEAEAARIDTALDTMAAEPFDLAAAAPLRAALLHLGPGRHALLLCVHHIAFDGWSGAIFASEFVAAYAALRDDRPSTLPPLRVQYADYAVWHARMLEATRAQDTAFWRRYLDNAPKGSRLPADEQMQAVTAHAGDSLRVPIEGALVETLNPLALANKTSRFTVMLAAFLALVHREAGVDDLVIGTDVAGRDHPGLEKLMGFFVNVVPLRSRRNADIRFTEWLAQVHASTQSALAHGSVPFDRILDAAGISRAQGGPVRMLFVMQNTPASHFEIPGLRIDVVPQRVRHSKFDIAVFVHEGPRDRPAEWTAEWVYDTGLYRGESIRRWAADWCALLRQWVISPDARVEQLFSSPARKESSMNPMPSPQLGKLDKLKKFAAKTPIATAAAEPATSSIPATALPPVKTSFLSADREFPLVVEAMGSDFDALAWVRGHRDFVDDALARHGGLLFRNFGLQTPQDFEAFAENVEPELYGSYGDLPKKEGGRRTYRSTPYPERQMILYHNESSHMERWPRKQWFYCELPSPVGGATPIVDCREMLRRLPAEIVEAFERKALTYVRTFTPHLDVSWRDFFKTDQRVEVEARLTAGGVEWRWLDPDTLQTRTHCPAVMKHPLTGERVFFNQVQLHHPACLEADVREDLLALVGTERMPRYVCYGDGTPIDDETMAIVGRTYEACAVRFDWRKGDVVMLDNMLAAHARDPYQGPRKIVVAMGAMFERATLLAAEAAGTAAVAETAGSE
ncbi:non-ribosomal peptide synthetase [Variovorax paradoxus]|uniref:non-ribosomal peptide synthetase n=1 Tax=Variovorax paradoxus TaxID=34073 RepID=UPI002783B924|nr:non-ribosomal peptide synthetase [Variovorax paradoxus]MDQ0590035.1 amino acid adenylation domain-containing protein [Variovorax paradoxus]